MTDGHYAKRAGKILKSVKYATIATASQGAEPWNSPVAHEYDNELNIYWFSDKNNQHSRNVRENGRVFIVIYDSTVPEGDGEGVYIRAEAVEVTDPAEVQFARRIKKGSHYDRPADDFLGDAIRRAYKAVPLQVWMNDAEVKEGVFVRDYRVEISLEELKAAL